MRITVLIWFVVAAFGSIGVHGQAKTVRCSDFEMRQIGDAKTTGQLYALRKFIWTNWQRGRPACANFAIYGKEDDPWRSSFAITVDKSGTKKLAVNRLTHDMQPATLWEVFAIRHDP